jgi:hypothetical protein
VALASVIAPLRHRCLTLLLALVAWCVVPATPRIAATDGGPTTQYAARIAATPVTLERATDRRDAGTRPEEGDDALPRPSFDPPHAAVDLAPGPREGDDGPFVARTRSSAQPRGPPLA